jgi:hypothetical protein
MLSGKLTAGRASGWRRYCVCGQARPQQRPPDWSPGPAAEKLTKGADFGQRHFHFAGPRGAQSLRLRAAGCLVGCRRVGHSAPGRAKPAAPAFTSRLWQSPTVSGKACFPPQGVRWRASGERFEGVGCPDMVRPVLGQEIPFLAYWTPVQCRSPKRGVHILLCTLLLPVSRRGVIETIDSIALT